MSKACAKCEKTVYPLEELKCLDKMWHKRCFKCSECGMALNMKTYKGFNKFPYCEAHIPKAKATTVAETPELKRIQENTKIQSNAAYHAEFEKSKGKFTPVADDPELMRIKQNSRIISNVTYHGDLEKKALMEQKRNLGGEGEVMNKNGVPPPRSPSSYMEELSSLPTSQPPPPAPVTHHHQQQQYLQQHQQHAYGQAQPQVPQQQQHQASPASYNQQRAPTSSAPGYNSHNASQNRHNVPQQYHNPQQQQPHTQLPYDLQPPRQHQDRGYQQQQQQHHYQQAQPQYQPPPQHYGSHQSSGGVSNASPYSNRGQQNVIYSSSDGGAVASSARKVGSISDYDPMNNYYGTDGQMGRSTDPQRTMQQGGRIQQGQMQHHQSSRGQPMTGHHHQPPPQQQMHYPTKYMALYDYDAQDVDEVSFSEGDIIVESTPIEEGWLTGTVQRSGKRGMLPANYVAPLGN